MNNYLLHFTLSPHPLSPSRDDSPTDCLSAAVNLFIDQVSIATTTDGAVARVARHFASASMALSSSVASRDMETKAVLASINVGAKDLAVGLGMEQDRSATPRYARHRESLFLHSLDTKPPLSVVVRLKYTSGLRLEILLKLVVARLVRCFDRARYGICSLILCYFG